MTQNCCFHCNEAIPADISLVTVINHKPEPMCCLGCQAVSQAIIDAGLTSYYTYRSEPAAKQAIVPDELNQFMAYDLPEVQQDFIYEQHNIDSVSLSIDGITCAACAWLIEHKLKQQSGIANIQVNSVTARALISWDKSQLKLSDILHQISAIGYQAAPYIVDQQEQLAKQASKKFLLRLGLAGLATMQVMMFAFALYAGFFTDLETEYRDYFRWVSMMFAAPVVFYSAQPFYFSALRSLLLGKVNMDMSVSIAILSAYIASCIATYHGNGEVYFESVSMFTFFLLLGRLFEQQAKQKATVSFNNLHKLVPLTATKLNADGQLTVISAKQIQLGDHLVVKPGEAIAADGVIIEGLSSLNEAMLTGEQMPVNKVLNDNVYAGTLNVEQPITIEVTAIGQNQLVAEIIRLQELASHNKPKIALLVDKMAHWFSAIILAIAFITYCVWWFISPEDAFWVCLSVLVATCPCALALATPTAITCASAKLTDLGIIIRKDGVFEKLNQLNQIVFDKTGTLTCGEFALIKTHTFAELSKEQVQQIAALMEQKSLHPIAKAFNHITLGDDLDIKQLQHHVGQGISATVNGKQYRLGKAEFVGVENSHEDINTISIWLANEQQCIAQFVISDQLRCDSLNTINQLKGMGYQLSIASGDNSNHLDYIAKKLAISEYYAGQSPAQKLALIKQKQQQSNVTMFGDGINDAPVLAAADLSVAMGSGSSIAKSSADLILLGDHLSRFPQAISLAKQSQRIIMQNLWWALIYNLLILPLAVTGMVAPYIAALGMSLSSLIVVANSLRILRMKL
ncbi:heavy metal translocating P-type ATPase [Shewanella marina]|uniref:heavy metal translocating P-type ATPase n=1 Tax=Shewanella marina TaxID=487319 RepID=UPI00046FE8A4|nr:heavy metal translocating P-type ATPase [Shewanella marina]